MRKEAENSYHTNDGHNKYSLDCVLRMMCAEEHTQKRLVKKKKK